MKIKRITSILCLLAGLGPFALLEAQTRSEACLKEIFSREESLRAVAAGLQSRSRLDPHRPAVTSASSPTTRAGLWGPPDRLTLSLLKTDVIDRRYIDKDHYTMADVLEGAYSEANKDLDDMPMAGMTRPSFASLDKRGGRYNHGLWSEVYPFPCQKPVGQVIVMAPDFKGAAQPEAVRSLRNGEVTLGMERGDRRLNVGYLLSMEQNVSAFELDFENLSEPLTLRLYRNLDQGHRRYIEEDGSYKKVVVYQPADPDQPLEYYDFEADRAQNGRFEAPTCGSDGRFFWVHQVFPAEKTFPDGFRYVLMAMVSDAEPVFASHPLQKGLGTPPGIPRDPQGYLMVPGIRTTTHPEMVELQALNYSYVAEAPGVAVDARLKTAGKGKARLYVAIVTVNETPDYMERAKQLLLEAEKKGYEGLVAENEAWYDRLYAKRENGRIFLGKTGEERKEAAGYFCRQAFMSWTSGHMGYCFPDPRKYEGSASYAAFDVDTQNWHSLPCYNELFTEGPYFTRNQYEPKLQWPRLVSHWHETLKERARLRFGLPGLILPHGYLPAAAQSPWYAENAVLDFTMEVAGQVMKVIWNFWDYTGDEAYLRETCYPLLRDLAIFYEAFARRGWDGKVYNLEPTVETESYGISYRMEYTRNNTGALAMFRKILHLACEAAEYLGKDADLIPGWREVADHLAPYPRFRMEGGEVIGANEKAFPRYTRGDHFMYSGFYPVNLADEIHLDSPAEEKALISRTADLLGSGRDVQVLIGHCKDDVPRSYAYGARKITDYATLAGQIAATPERLMNSRSGRIHLFPAVPDWTEAAFRCFLARGGFEVSAARKEEGVQAVVVKARRGIPLRLMNPWPGTRPVVTDLGSGSRVAYTLDASNGECLVFPAEAGHTYSFDPAAAPGRGQTAYPFQDPDLPLEERVDDLVGRLSLEEKIAQMMNNAPAIPRLGVPAYNWWNECLHGVARSPYPVTSFPQAIALAATWDTASVFRMATYASDEGRAIYHDAVRKGKPGIFTGLTYWSPNINIFRDPRWGRGQETYGEDPFLTGEIGAAFVRGLQGDDPVYLKTAACAKHYAVHSGPEWNRHTYNAEIGNQDLWDTYLPAFRKLVVEAGVAGVMCAYNSFFDQPCCGNDLLMNDILRNQWGFEGYVTSDCGAIEDFYKTHRTHPSAAEASADAVLHGTDCECSGHGAYRALADAVGEGLITEQQIDASVKKLFEIRFRLGMFDPEERVPYARLPLSVLECDAHRAAALETARRSIVLLKNENGLLPLDREKIKKIAVVGPNADDRRVLLANYYGYPSKIVTLREGIEAKAGKGMEVVYEKGVNLTDDFVFTSSYDASLFSYDGKPGFWAEYYPNTRWEQAPVLARREEKVDYQWGDGQDIGPGVIARQMSARWTTWFTPAVTGEVCFELEADDRADLYVDGVRREKVGNVNAYYVLQAEKGRSYRIEIRYMQQADNAEIRFDLGTLRKADFREVCASVGDADVIVFAGGISAQVEGEEMGVRIDGFKQGDRTSLSLPAVQRDLLKELQATGKPVVLVLMTGSAIGLEWEAAHLPAIVNAWYGGQAGGQAAADVLFGDYNPAGRLPVTFYRSVEDLPDFEDYGMENRTYRYFSGKPVYPFGYGLSYTTFRYDGLEVIREPVIREPVSRDVSGRTPAGGTPLNSGEAGAGLRIRAHVANTGDRDGEEVVQLYVSNPRDFRTPVRALKGFKRIRLKAGESAAVEFALSSEALSVVDTTGASVPMKGRVFISVGGGQPDDTAAGRACLQKEIDLSD